MALRRHIVLSVGRPPGPDWRWRPGRPRARWTDQIQRDSRSSPVELWRRAIRRGHAVGATQRPPPAARWWRWRGHTQIKLQPTYMQKRLQAYRFKADCFGVTWCWWVKSSICWLVGSSVRKFSLKTSRRLTVPGVRVATRDQLAGARSVHCTSVWCIMSSVAWWIDCAAISATSFCKNKAVAV